MDIFEKDFGLDEIIKSVQSFGDRNVKVGIQSGDMTEDGKTSLAYVASLHEFGSPGGMIPERSFIRAGLEEKQGEIEGDFATLAAKIFVAGASPGQILDLLGQKATGIIQQKIVDGPFTPDKPETIKRKRSNSPLIDTGHLRQSIRHKVED